VAALPGSRLGPVVRRRCLTRTVDNWTRAFNVWRLVVENAEVSAYVDADWSGYTRRDEPTFQVVVYSALDLRATKKLVEIAEKNGLELEIDNNGRGKLTFPPPESY
jgi:hypothetical protein